jgi:hypothetical protein
MWFVARVGHTGPPSVSSSECALVGCHGRPVQQGVCFSTGERAVCHEVACHVPARATKLVIRKWRCDIDDVVPVVVGVPDPLT